MVGKTIGIVMIINGFDGNFTLSILTESKLLTAPKSISSNTARKVSTEQKVKLESISKTSNHHQYQRVSSINNR